MQLGAYMSRMNTRLPTILKLSVRFKADLPIFNDNPARMKLSPLLISRGIIYRSQKPETIKFYGRPDLVLTGMY